MGYGVDPQEDALRRGIRPGGTGWGIDDATCWTELTLAPDGAKAAPASSRIDSLPGDYLAYYRGVLRALRGDGPVPVDAHDARQVIQLIEAAQRSSQEQRTLPLA